MTSVAVKLLEHGMKVLDRVLEIRHHRIVTANEFQFSFMPLRETIDVMFILRRLQEEYRANEKMLYMCFWN